MFKEEVTQYCSMCEEWAEKYDQLKEEIEKEKALKQTYLACYKTKHRDVKGKLFKYEKYKQALQEIEKLAFQGNIYCIYYNVDDCEKCIKQNDCKTTLFKQILQKCEVIKDDN